MAVLDFSKKEVVNHEMEIYHFMRDYLESPIIRIAGVDGYYVYIERKKVSKENVLSPKWRASFFKYLKKFYKTNPDIGYTGNYPHIFDKIIERDEGNIKIKDFYPLMNVYDDISEWVFNSIIENF